MKKKRNKKVGYGIRLGKISASTDFKKLANFCRLTGIPGFEDDIIWYVEDDVDLAAENPSYEEAMEIAMDHGYINDFIARAEGPDGEKGLTFYIRYALGKEGVPTKFYSSDSDYLLIEPRYPWDPMTSKERTLTPIEFHRMVESYFFILFGDQTTPNIDFFEIEMFDEEEEK